MRRFLTSGTVLVTLLAAAAGCGGSHSGSRPDPRRWLALDAGSHTATITVIASYDATASGFNLDGAIKGALLFRVPSSWSVAIRCVNNATGVRYACALLPSPGQSGTQAFGGQSATRASRGQLAALTAAAAPHPPDGLSAGQQTIFSLSALGAGRYRVVALTEGREPSGMWITLEVTRGGSPGVLWIR